MVDVLSGSLILLAEACKRFGDLLRRPDTFAGAPPVFSLSCLKRLWGL
jgi:hypothetical protein